MAKKNRKKSSLYRFEEMEGSQAIQKQPLDNNQGGPSNRVSSKSFLGRFNEPIKNLDQTDFPHHNRLLGYAHSLCETVAEKAKQKLIAKGEKEACGAGCDACCYYADLEATGAEFEEMVHYIKHKLPESVRQNLSQQVQEAPNYTKHGFQPCPFLNRTNGQCGVYPVRPMACRGLLATKKCQLDVEEDTGLELTVSLIQESWQEMPVSGGTIMLVQEQWKKGKGHTNLNQNSTEFIVKLKELEPEKLTQLFGSS